MQFIHLTDLHADVERKHFGIDALERLERAVKHAAAHAPDAVFVAVTGDIAERGDEASYRKVREILDQTHCPVFLVPGNHDDPTVMARVFAKAPSVELANASGARWAQALRSPDFNAVFLDTHAEGTGAGEPKAKDLEILREALKSEKPVFLFMHHPPFSSGIPAMDSLGLSNADALRRLFDETGRKPAALFCGHLHRSIAGLWAGVPVFVLRSLVQEVNPFSHDPTRIAYCAEAPEYALVDVSMRTDGPPAVLSQTIRFTEPGTPIVDTPD